MALSIGSRNSRKAVEPVFRALYKSVATGNETRITLKANSAKGYRAKLEKELKEIRDSEMWKVGAAVRLAPSRKLEEVGINVSHAAPFISLAGVSIRLHGGVLFDGLDWEIKSDQQWAVLGPNGSGKSALMKVLAGNFRRLGRDQPPFLEHGEAAHEHVAYVAFEAQREVLGPEAYYQDRWNAGLSEKAPTVSDILSERGIRHANPFVVDIPILHKNVKYRDTGFAVRQKKIIRDFGLQALLDRKLLQLSNGERRKVSIARALLKNPKLLILDNPFEGLDVRFRAVLKKNLESLMRGKMRIIIVGTGREEIPDGITHVLRIHGDHMVSVGLCEEMLSASSSTNAVVPSKRKSAPKKSSRVLVEMKNVNVSYNKIPVLRKLSWTVREGEKWALFGPNGAGKTTLLSLILGDNPQAYANDITLFGKRRGTGESIWEIKRNIGWVSPELQLYYPAGATCLDVVCAGFFDTVGLYRAPLPHQEKVARSWLKEIRPRRTRRCIVRGYFRRGGAACALARAGQRPRASRSGRTMPRT